MLIYWTDVHVHVHVGCFENGPLKVVDPICRYTSQNYARMKNIISCQCIWNLIVVGCKIFK